jgi:hypothetical protein
VLGSGNSGTAGSGTVFSTVLEYNLVFHHCQNSSYLALLVLNLLLIFGKVCFLPFPEQSTTNCYISFCWREGNQGFPLDCRKCYTSLLSFFDWTHERLAKALHH